MAGSVLVVRHALSTWNAESRWAGQADPPLAVAGTAQARRLGRLLLHARRRPTAVLASDLRRAADTARVAGPSSGSPRPRSTADCVSGGRPGRV